MITRIALLAAVTLPALPAQAAVLRPVATLEGPVVHVSDLFDDAGPAGARVLGPGPAPGGRIVVEAAQLAAIARQFGVDWRPASNNDRAVLDRAGRLLPREGVMAALRAALTHAGAPEDCEIELPGFAAPVVAPESSPQSTIEHLDYDNASGRFTASLAVTADGMAMQRMRLAGTVQEMMDVPVPVRRLPGGTVVQAGDLLVQRVRAGLAHGEVARTPAQAIGMAVRHPMLAGQPLALAELTRPAAVLKGARVTMQLQSAGLTLSAVGQALEAGALGDRIAVLNPTSRAIVQAEIVAPDRVRVLPPGVSPPERPTQFSAALPASLVQ